MKRRLLALLLALLLSLGCLTGCSLLGEEALYNLAAEAADSLLSEAGISDEDARELLSRASEAADALLSEADLSSEEAKEFLSLAAEAADAFFSETESASGGKDSSSSAEAAAPATTPAPDDDYTRTDGKVTVVYGEDYTDKDRVALYIHSFGELPPNYITKKEAEQWGWDSSKNTLAEAVPGMSIGGDRFYNREGQLPEAKGRTYRECDIDYVSGSRGAKRIVFSNDGLIYYTGDHYSSFTLLYGEE